MPPIYPPAPAWSRSLLSVGVTGTNGKTSTTTFVAAGLQVGAPAGLVARVTTVESALADERRPPPDDHAGFSSLMAELYARGGRRAAVEATSAALALGFAAAWPMRVAVFTNLGHDHLAMHGSPEHYLASKAQLFVHLPVGGCAVLNAGCPESELIAEVVPDHARRLWFAGPDRALDRAVALRITWVSPSADGLELGLDAAPELGELPERVRLRSLAAIQAENFAAALLACIAAGVPGAAAAEAISACPPPAGRFELVVGPPGSPRVVVDYAHGPDALRSLLADARRLNPARIVLVLGAGGGADPSKRAPMGQASAGADRLWLTSDNPRHEDPALIAAQVRAGVPPEVSCVVELDRKAAIRGAIAEAGCDDLVVVAGKGHEYGQILADCTLPFSDREVVRSALDERIAETY